MSSAVKAAHALLNTNRLPQFEREALLDQLEVLRKDHGNGDPNIDSHIREFMDEVSALNKKYPPVLSREEFESHMKKMNQLTPRHFIAIGFSAFAICLGYAAMSNAKANSKELNLMRNA